MVTDDLVFMRTSARLDEDPQSADPLSYRSWIYSYFGNVMTKFREYRVFLTQYSSAENTRMDSSISVNNGLTGKKNNDRINFSVFIFATT